jgi:diadenosine tetraphosphate (Ap4A) HIT family hydrolase
MARINPDSSGGQVFALINQVTGLVDSEEEAMAMVRSLEEGGVATDDIDVFVGEQGARSLDLSGREHGRIMRWLRQLEGAMGDETTPKRRIEQGLSRGGSLVCVKVHKGKVDEKPRAFRILEALHGHEIHYWGPWAYEDVRATGCVFCKLPVDRADRIVGENEHVMWIFDAHPVTPGHSLIIPKRHVESLFEATPAEREAIVALLDRARAHVSGNRAPSGFNISIDEGTVGREAAIVHLHVHLIPRYSSESRKTRDALRLLIPERVV